MDKISRLGCPCHPKNYPRSTSVKAWGCPRIPSSLTNCRVLFQCAIFLLLHIICAVLGASLFLFLVFFCFVCCNKWLEPIIHVLEKTPSVLIAWNTLVFTLIVPRVFQFFQYCIQLFFSLLFCSELVQFSLLMFDQLSVLCWKLSLRVVSNQLIGVGDEFYISSDANERLFRLWHVP